MGKLSLLTFAIFTLILFSSTVIGLSKDEKYVTGASVVATKERKVSYVTCPVMGSKLNPKKAREKINYKGKTYFLCCSDCVKKFRAAPAKYAK